MNKQSDFENTISPIMISSRTAEAVALNVSSRVVASATDGLKVSGSIPGSGKVNFSKISQ